MHIKIKFLNLFAILAVVMLLSCNNSTSGKKVKVGYLPMVSSLTHFIAVEQGFYKESGLEVEAIPIKTSNLIAQDVIVGNIDVGIELSIIPLLKQLEVNKDAAKIFSVSSITIKNGFDGILVKQNSTIKKLKDLSEKKVGVFPGSTAKNSLMAVFEDSCWGLKPPLFIELDPSVHLESLQSDEIDALFTYEPSLTIGTKKDGFVKVISSIYGMQYSPNPIGVAVVNNKWALENSETAKLLYKALDKSVDFIESNPESARNILAKYTELDFEVAKAINIMPMSKSNEINYENLDGYISILLELSEITNHINAKEICLQK